MRPTEDQYRHRGLRKKLVEEVRKKGITDERVLDALMAVPRHFFLDSAFDQQAYEDKAFPIGSGQTISQPYTVAYQTQLLQCRPFDKVLEIGTGSGYQCAVLASLGTQAFTIERQKPLFDANREFRYLHSFPNIKFFYGDGYEGLPTYAPFDRVIVTAAAPFIPTKLIDQMKVGGVMVIPVNEGDFQRMLRITRISADDINEEKFDLFSFVPMLEGKNNH
jgi:protein-L-isoaspartate(D-aspartate) O-methyltransferase